MIHGVVGVDLASWRWPHLHFCILQDAIKGMTATLAWALLSNIRLAAYNVTVDSNRECISFPLMQVIE